MNEEKQSISDYSNITFSFSFFTPRDNERYDRKLKIENQNWYARYFPILIPLLIELFRNCKIIIYHNDALYNSFYANVLVELDKKNIIRLIPVYETPEVCIGMLWRMKVLWDAETKYVFIRDLDAMPTPRERVMIDQFLTSGKMCHAINDCSSHCANLLGGMIGFDKEWLKAHMGYNEWIDIIFSGQHTIKFNSYGDDQALLQITIWDKIKEFTLSHRTGWSMNDNVCTIIKTIPDPLFEDMSKERVNALGEFSKVIGIPYGRLGEILNIIDNKEISDIERKYKTKRQHVGREDNKMKRVLFSITDNEIYSFFAPIVSVLWKEYVGFVPAIIVIGEYGEWMTDKTKKYIIEKCVEVGAEIHFAPRIKGFLDSTVAQVARLYGHTLGYDKNTWIMTADADMIPMTKTWFVEPDEYKLLQIYYPDAYNYQKFPICYIGATSKIWGEIMDSHSLENQLNNGLGCGQTGMKAWCYDEELFIIRAKEWWESLDINKFRVTKFVERGNENGMAKGRVDRSNWIFDKNRTDYIDCHSLRPAQDEENWKKILDLLLWLHPVRTEWFNEYRNGFLATKL